MCTRDAVAMATASAASAPVFTHPDMMRSNRQVALVVGGSASVRCEARGSPAPAVVWYKDDAILEHQVTWSLELRHVTVEDGGLYVCVVYNHVGSIDFSYNLIVKSISVSQF